METNDIREKIIASAQQKMGEVGIRSVSIDDICHEIGMSKKTFYVYFATKDDLIQAILDYHYEEVRSGMQSFLDSCKSMWDGIRRGAEKIAAMPDVRQLPPFIYDLNKYYPTLAKNYNARILTLNERLMKRIVERSIDEGIFRKDVDVDLAAMMLARLHNNAVNAGLEGDGKAVSFTRLADFTLAVVPRGLFSAEGTRRYEELMQNVKRKK